MFFYYSWKMILFFLAESHYTTLICLVYFCEASKTEEIFCVELII